MYIKLQHFNIKISRKSNFLEDIPKVTGYEQLISKIGEFDDSEIYPE